MMQPETDYLANGEENLFITDENFKSWAKY